MVFVIMMIMVNFPMKKTMPGIFAAMLLTGLMVFPVARASVIHEVEANNSLASAQILSESDFTTGTQVGIDNSAIGWEWVSIQSYNDSAQAASVDYYQFNVNAGQRFIFDIDSVDTDIDSVIDLYFNGSQLATNDDAPDSTDAGDTTNSYLDLTFADAGTGVIRVSEYPYGVITLGGPNGVVSTTISTTSIDILPAAIYTLQISRESTSVPEPSISALLGIGFLAIGLISGYSRRATGSPC